MGKIIAKKISNRMNPYTDSKVLQFGGIVGPETSTGKGGFSPPADETTLGTMTTIMTDQFNKK